MDTPESPDEPQDPWPSGHPDATPEPTDPVRFVTPPPFGPPVLAVPGPEQIRRTRRRRRFGIAGWVALVLAVVLVWAGQLIRIDYYTEAPGDAVPVQPLVAIDGAPSYESDGSFMLLYIRRRDRITLLRYVQAWLDPDIDARSFDYDQPFQSPEDQDALSQSDMTRAQFAARKLALERIGEQVEVLDGLVVTSVVEGKPASKVLQAGDVVLAIDGRDIGPGDPDDVLTSTIRSHDIGDDITVTFERDGERRTESITTVSNGASGEDEKPYIGILLDVRYDYPFAIEFEGQIETIGGPSAGLAMTLALLDELTEGELSGGGDVAVTGTIDVDGNVGNVGRVDLKAKAAARRGATLMLVPTCHEPAEPDAYASRADYESVLEFKRSCDEQVRKADDAVDTVVEVATLDEALAALEAHGGDPVPGP